jgi:hypothetical protein
MGKVSFFYKIEELPNIGRATRIVYNYSSPFT